jgi:hypothetical protein
LHFFSSHLKNHGCAAAIAAVDDECLLRVREVGPRDVKTDLVLARRALEIGELRAVVRFAQGSMAPC